VSASLCLAKHTGRDLSGQQPLLSTLISMPAASQDLLFCCRQVAEFKQRLVRAKKQVMALKKQAADTADERDAARAELAALRDAPPAGVHSCIASVLRWQTCKVHSSAQVWSLIQHCIGALMQRFMSVLAW